MTVNDGEYEADSDVDAVLNRMIDNAKHYWGEDLSEDSLSAIRVFYQPIAEELLELQGDIGLVLQASQIDNAHDTSLDLLCSLINVTRFAPQKATGTARFLKDNTSSQDYVVPEGTIVQTHAEDPVRFETTERGVIEAGETKVDIPIVAREAGVEGNVATDRIIDFEDKPAGIDSVTNPNPTDGGTEEEDDESLRERAKDELADGAGASAPAILSEINQISEQVRSVSIEINDSSTDNRPGGLPDHSFEVIAESPSEFYQDIAEAIFDKKAAGDHSYSGLHGDAVTKDVVLSNGQTHSVSFSTPTEIDIYVEAEVEVKDTFPGEDAVRDAIVGYLGGTDVDGEPVAGELRAGYDVIHGEVEYAIRSVPGVYDVTLLEIGTDATPDSTQNISIDQTDLAVYQADTTDRLSLTTTNV